MLRKSCKAEQVLLRIRRGREVPSFKKENDAKRDERRVCLFFLILFIKNQKKEERRGGHRRSR